MTTWLTQTGCGQGTSFGTWEMAMKREATLIVIIITYSMIICWRTGISFYSWFGKSELIKRGVWVCAEDGGGRSRVLEV